MNKEGKKPSVAVWSLDAEQSRRISGVFLSHSSRDDAELDEVIEAMRPTPLAPVYDRREVRTGDDFKERIEKLLRCRAGVMIVSESSLRSEWVDYEIGFLEGMGVPILLYDPKGVLSSFKRGRKLRQRVLNAHLSRYLPAVTDKEELIRRLNGFWLYADLFPGREVNGFTREAFTERMKTAIGTVELRVTSELFLGEAEAFRDCRVGALTVNFGHFHTGESGGCPFCREGRCQGEAPCSLSGIAAFDAKGEPRECLLLNCVLPSGRFFTEREEGRPVSGLSVYVPVHKTYGTEFKIVIDPPGASQRDRLLSLLSAAGMNPSLSDSRNSNRIYLSLPPDPSLALFRLLGGFRNNFFCHAATRLTK